MTSPIAKKPVKRKGGKSGACGPVKLSLMARFLKFIGFTR